MATITATTTTTTIKTPLLRQNPSRHALRQRIPAPRLPTARRKRDIDVVAKRVLDDDGARAVRVAGGHGLDAGVPVVRVAALAAQHDGAFRHELGELRQRVVVDGELVRAGVLVDHEQAAARVAPALDVGAERPVRGLRPGAQRPHEGAFGPVLQRADRVLGGLVPGCLGRGL